MLPFIFHNAWTLYLRLLLEYRRKFIVIHLFAFWRLSTEILIRRIIYHTRININSYTRSPQQRPLLQGISAIAMKKPIHILVVVSSIPPIWAARTIFAELKWCGGKIIVYTPSIDDWAWYDRPRNWTNTFLIVELFFQYNIFSFLAYRQKALLSSALLRNNVNLSGYSKRHCLQLIIFILCYCH